MSISIRERKLENGRSRLILDSYQNSKRKVEKLELFIINKPQTKVERDRNKTTWQLANPALSLHKSVKTPIPLWLKHPLH